MPMSSLLSRTALLSLGSLVCLASPALANCPASLGTSLQLKCLNTSLNAAAATLASQATTITTLQTSVAALQAENDELYTYLYVDTASDAIVFTGANVYVQNGAGSSGGAVNGLGNLILGYDEDNGDTKTGSHVLVVGGYHTYTGAGGIVAGSRRMFHLIPKS